MTGQIILMLYGMVFLLLVPADAVFVSAFLMTAIYIGLWNLKIPYRMRQILPWVWLLLCLGVPELSIFVAAACYSMLNEERYIPAIILASVSYTHLDVYKRQEQSIRFFTFGLPNEIII